jgi:hypothetical protein
MCSKLSVVDVAGKNISWTLGVTESQCMRVIPLSALICFFRMYSYKQICIGQVFTESLVTCMKYRIEQKCLCIGVCACVRACVRACVCVCIQVTWIEVF